MSGCRAAADSPVPGDTGERQFPTRHYLVYSDDIVGQLANLSTEAPMRARRLVSHAPHQKAVDEFYLDDTPPPGSVMVRAAITAISTGTKIDNSKASSHEGGWS
ncbi:MAG TPA: hypothetical protein VMP10_02095 [Chloroflexota bacterium]|nr:hypothetical protein [Chloroflexota bacterium]